MSEIQEISVSSLFVDERNVRHGDDVDVGSLAEDIEENGVIQPIVVRPEGDEYGVVAGSRRFKASKKAGLDSMPCIVRDLDDDRAVALSVLENHSREDVEPKDQVKAIERYFKESDRVWTEKDKKDKLTSPVSEGGFGFPRQTANNYLSILSVDKEVREKYDLSAESSNADPWIEKELDVSKARKVGREMKDFSAEDQEKVIQEIEDKTFEESKEIVQDVSKKVREGEIESVELAIEEVKKDEPEIKNYNRTDRDIFSNTDFSNFENLSTKDKLVKILESELYDGLSLDRSNFRDKNSVKRDLYKIYISKCLAKNRYPMFFYNGSNIRSLNDFLQMIEDSGNNSTLKDVLDRWGELTLSSKTFEAGNYDGNNVKEKKETYFSKLGLENLDDKNSEKPSLI